MLELLYSSGLRRAELALMQMGDLRVIQTLLGHSRVDTTEIYTFVSTERICQAHQTAHPRG